MIVDVIGAGLAGCEAAWYLANNGIKVNLYEQKGIKMSPAHKSENFAELVCSNSLKASRLGSAAGLLKAEMELLGSLTVWVAKQTAVPAGGALAVDRDKFSQLITDKIKTHKNITVKTDIVEQIPRRGAHCASAPAINNNYTIIATGPLTDGKLAESIQEICGDNLSFYDAAAPIVTRESIDMNKAFYGARYNRGEPDYINCPMDKEEYERFYNELIKGETADLHEFDVYEGCMPIEVMAKRGVDTIRYGPLKPVGLRDLKTKERPWAVVQLRTENNIGTLYNLVGFQTNLKFGEQKRIFSLIPALNNAEFVRYGVMHRNTFINSPKFLHPTFATRNDPKLFFAGQITGVEGYMESAMSGIIAAMNVYRTIKNKEPFIPPQTTMCGALCKYISDESVTKFQPMGANFGILPPLSVQIRNKQERYQALGERGIKDMMQVITNSE